MTFRSLKQLFVALMVVAVTTAVTQATAQAPAPSPVMMESDAPAKCFVTALAPILLVLLACIFR
ncbi:hypothetical protein KP509_09G014100 [Ceratopteris richardii]|uniref:Uncharacterized protein n=1 Tax=Ceratopteris richardii TaxID=49495 RepID=A0A8T2U508_CERRI|nr:hypothetical protein KP509_09G014100 [Ceratopteris richardii]